MKFEFSDFSKGDFVNIVNIYGCSMDFLILSLSKANQCMRVLPIGKTEKRLTLSMPTCMIRNITLKEPYELLYHLNSDDKDIISSIEKYICRV